MQTLTLTQGSSLNYIRVIFTILVALLIFLMIDPAIFGGDHDYTRRMRINAQVDISTDSSQYKQVVSSQDSDSDQYKGSQVQTHFVSIKKNLMFLKTHKCGTSSLVNIFYLRGVRKKLNFVVQPDQHQLQLTELKQL